MVLYIYEKFDNNISNSFQLTDEYMVEMAMLNVQRAIIPKVDKPELPIICSACRLIVLYICVKFRENIMDGIRVMEWTRMMEALTDGQMS